ncbi:hypothetical protein OEZ86_014202 [Tetradesmus obliquus]|nr:hypothetical protein OEZ86_014202 [Tetradesmus obliquus]
MQPQNSEWQSIRVQPDLQSYPVQLRAISRPAGLEAAGACRANLEALQKLQPPLQTGPAAWCARVCYWSAADLQQLCTTELPTLVYEHAGMGRDTVLWQGIIALLKQQRPEGAELPLQEKGSSGRQQQQQGAAPPAAAVAAAADGGGLRNVLLLHVAGRNSDKSIYMLLVPQVDGEALASGASRHLLWAYFFVYRFEAFAERMYMQQHPSIAPLQLPDVQRALKARRTQDWAWQSCIEYQEHNQPMDSGLPAWAEQHGITLRPHLSKAVPFAQLDFVDRCYMQRSDEDNAASGRGSSGSASGGGCSRPDGGARLVDACGSGYAAAGAEQLLPLRVGSYEQFVAPCSCPKDLWCGGAPKREALAKLWSGELAPLLEVRPCSQPDKGLGLFAGEDLPEGSTVAEYTGELVPTKEAEAREEAYHAAGLFYLWCEEGDHALPPELVVSMQAKKQEMQHQQHQQQQRHRRKNQQPQQVQQPQQQQQQQGAPGRPAKVRALAAAEPPPRKYMIDATFVGGVARFANHSCDPNCRIVKVCNGGSQAGEPLLLVLLETLRDVAAGEELTFDYKPSSSSKPIQGKLRGLLECSCGAANCRGVVFPDKGQ